MYYFYIFECRDGTLYCGSTNNPENREKRHNSGHGAKYTRSHGGGKIVHKEEFFTIKEAMQREAEVKKWPRKKKQNLISSKLD